MCLFQLLFLTIVVGILSTCNGAQSETWEFDVVPGGQKRSFGEKLNGVSCEFTYVCQGGTKEQWHLIISKEDTGDYVCEVERPGPTDALSYLFFQEFKVTVAGKSLANGIVFGESKKNPVESLEYVVDFATNSVSSSKSFKSHLNKVIVTMAKGKEEL